MRDNLPEYRPPTDPVTGEPIFAPNGKHLESLAVAGPSFKIDGYGVEWDVGIKWRFNLGYNSHAGLTLYNVRVVLPPTEAKPEGELVPYAWLINIPNFGTAYSTSSVGNIYSATFLESHFSDGRGLVSGANCRGPGRTLPLFRARGHSALGDLADTKIFYSSYGPEVFKEDSYGKLLGFDGLPYQDFSLETGGAGDGIIEQAVCISEMDNGHAIWHLYAAQRARKLQISQTTISDAYNVLLQYELHSDGRFKVAERLHGKPAIVNMGLPTIGGAYATGGKGGFATNHVHWHSVAIEPHIKRNIKGVTNKLAAADLTMKTEETNWYGMAFNRVPTDVEWSNQTDLLKMDYEKNRFWVMAAVDEEGNEIGGLSVRSPAWAPAPFEDIMAPPMKYAELAPELDAEDTFANHWQDAYVQNADYTKAKQLMLSPSFTPDCSPGGSTRRCLPDEKIGGDPIMHFLMKIYHGVTTDEMPIQNGFNIVELEIWPHNLFPMNPNTLVRYMPEYAAHVQNNDFYDGPTIYTPPYAMEWEDFDQKKEL